MRYTFHIIAFAMLATLAVVLSSCMLSEEAQRELVTTTVKAMEVNFMEQMKSLVDTGKLTGEQFATMLVDLREASTQGIKAGMAKPVTQVADWDEWKQVGGVVGATLLGSTGLSQFRRRGNIDVGLIGRLLNAVFPKQKPAT